MQSTYNDLTVVIFNYSSDASWILGGVSSCTFPLSCYCPSGRVYRRKHWLWETAWLLFVLSRKFECIRCFIICLTELNLCLSRCCSARISQSLWISRPSWLIFILIPYVKAPLLHIGWIYSKWLYCYKGVDRTSLLIFWGHHQGAPSFP